MTEGSGQFERIAIVGVGLIGGSIALGARARKLCRTILGVGRNLERLETAVEQGVIDSGVATIGDLEAVDLVIVCTPVDRIAEDVRVALQSTPQATLVTDAGSVKAGLCQQIAQLPGGPDRFLGAHPLAGSHQSGFEFATSELLVNRKCVVTPFENSPRSLIEAITGFWTALGMHVHTTTAAEHDRILALVSHLPHLVAAAVAGMVPFPSLEFASTGFRDTTRVAAGDPELWTAIFHDNSDQLAAATSDLIELLELYRHALTSNNREAMLELLKSGQDHRHHFDQLQSHPIH